jgi:hypothetical protein
MGFTPFHRVGGISAEMDFRRWHIRMAQPERDFAELPRGFHDHHGACVTQDMRHDLLCREGGTAMSRETDIFTDGQTGSFGRDNGRDTFAIGVCKPRGREAEPGDQLLFATDTRSPCLRGVHTPEHPRLPPSCPVH